jgi:enediyne polyketide synthase
VLRRLVGAAAAAPGVHRRPDGKPEVPGGPRVSLAHAGDLVLAVAGEGPLGCDLEPVEPRSEATWRDLLGPERLRLAEEIAAGGGGRDAAATRVWTAVECLKKAGALSDAPLVWVPPEAAGPSPGEPEDGWLLLRSGELTIGTLVASVERPGTPLAVAVLLRSAGRAAAVRVG